MTLEYEAVIEIPRGSRNKYEIDHETGAVWLDRRLFTSMAYPADYGYLEGTLGEDGDPLDVLLLLDEPTYPGVHVNVRPVAVFWMTDDAGPDAKILAVPAGDTRHEKIKDLGDVSPHLLEEIQHFFKAYKDLEPGKFSDVRDWEGVDAAVKEIDAAIERAGSAGH